MNTFSDLLANDHKDALRSTVTSLKKLMVKHWWQTTEADVEVVLKSIHDPSCVYLHQHLTTKGIRCDGASDRGTWGVDLPQAAAQKGVEDGGLAAHCDVLWSPLGGAHSHVGICSQHVITSQDCQPRDLQHGHEGSCTTDDSDQCPRALPESSPRSTPQRWLQKNDCPQLVKVLLPWVHLLHRNHGTDPPNCWLWLFGCASNASFSMAAPPRRLALHLRSRPSSCPNCCQVKFTSVALLEPPKEIKSGPTPWPMKET